MQQAFMNIGLDGLPEDGGLTRVVMDVSMERVYFSDYVQRIFSDDGQGDGHVTLKGIEVMKSVFSAWDGGYLYSDEVSPLEILLFSASREDIVAKHNEYMDRIEANARIRLWERKTSVKKIDSETNALSGNKTSQARYLLLKQMLPAMGKVVHELDMADARRDATIIGIALHRYRLAHGSFPDSLDALVPEFVPRLGLDPADGKPLRYVLGANGPIIYSLGGDGDDDGGVDGTLTATDRRHIEPGLSLPENGDWVLYPIATPVEDE